MSLTKTPVSMIDTTGATTGQVLTYNASTTNWVASAAPSSSQSSFYTMVGNASAGIFSSAVAYTPSSIGVDTPGTWTAPAGCFSARVTLVGGGATPDGGPGGIAVQGGHSRFNYSTGFTPGDNQAVASGGNSSAYPYYGPGYGFAGWNGITSTATSIGARGYSWISLSASSFSNLSKLSPAALSLNTVTTALSSVGYGRRTGWAAAGVTATVAVTPGTPYSYTVGAGADGFYDDAYPGIVIIEW